jgi:hypothetical protein
MRLFTLYGNRTTGMAKNPQQALFLWANEHDKGGDEINIGAIIMDGQWLLRKL